MKNKHNNNLQVKNNKKNNFEVDNLLVNQQPILKKITKVNAKFNVFSKKKLILTITFIIIFIGLISSIFVFILNNSFVNYETNVNMIELGDEIIYLKQGDKLIVNAWNPPIEVYLNDDELNNKNIPELYNGVTLGTNVKDVIMKFNIKSGYAMLNMEVPTKQEDGTTDIVNKRFKNLNSIPNNFLDCAIIFGYKKVNNKWKMVKEKNLKDADIIYYIDINGFDDEMYELNDVIKFKIKYNEKEK